MEPLTVNTRPATQGRHVARAKPEATKPGEYGSTGAALKIGDPPGHNDA